MTLRDILIEVERLRGDIGCDHVTIERVDVVPVRRQWKFVPSRERVVGYSLHKRRRFEGVLLGDRTGLDWTAWLEVDPSLETFTLTDVLADDWRFA